MRHLPVIALATVAFLLAAGCRERTNMRELPDRQGHAYRTAGAERPVAAGPRVPLEGEIVYSAQKGDTLKSVGTKYKVTIDWLVRRNELESNDLKPGQSLIVPQAK